jgi:hypothetical protein
MEQIPLQRLDIAQVVGEYQGKSTYDVLEELEQAQARKRRRRVPREEREPSAWYAVVDEIIEGRVAIGAWPWPTVDPLTNYLSFDLERARQATFEAPDLHGVVSSHRSQGGAEATANRPLRIGDVFEVEAARISDLGTWTAVTDHTKEKRAEARAAMDAMATPPHPSDKAAEFERLAQEQQATAEEPTWTKTHSAI